MEHCHKIVPKETYNIDDILHKKSKMFSKMQKLWSLTIVYLQNIKIKWIVLFAMQLSKTVAGAAYLAAWLCYVTSGILIQTIEADHHLLLIFTAKHLKIN